MNDRGVEALRIVLDDQLPVGLQVIDTSFDHLQLFHAPRTEFLIEASQMLREWNWPGGKIDEDVTVPDMCRNAVQRIIRLAEALHLFHVRRVGQRAVQLVSPRVIPALNPSGETALILRAKQCPAMAADVIEGAA